MSIHLLHCLLSQEWSANGMKYFQNSLGTYYLLSEINLYVELIDMDFFRLVADRVYALTMF